MSHVPETAQQIYTQTLDKMMADLERSVAYSFKSENNYLIGNNKSGSGRTGRRFFLCMNIAWWMKKSQWCNLSLLNQTVPSTSNAMFAHTYILTACYAGWHGGQQRRTMFAHIYPHKILHESTQDTWLILIFLCDYFIQEEIWNAVKWCIWCTFGNKKDIVIFAACVWIKWREAYSCFYPQTTMTQWVPSLSRCAVLWPHRKSPGGSKHTLSSVSIALRFYTISLTWLNLPALLHYLVLLTWSHLTECTSSLITWTLLCLTWSYLTESAIGFVFTKMLCLCGGSICVWLVMELAASWLFIRILKKVYCWCRWSFLSEIFKFMMWL